MVEERFHGQDGYTDYGLALIDMEICSCDGCGGHLVDGTCTSCGCMHHVTEPTNHQRQRQPAWIPAWQPDGPRCAHAEAVALAVAAEHARTEQKRRRLLHEGASDSGC
jgi:hypothetical protein